MRISCIASACKNYTRARSKKYARAACHRGTADGALRDAQAMHANARAASMPDLLAALVRRAQAAWNVLLCFRRVRSE